jgi:hypothetical protein
MPPNIETMFITIAVLFACGAILMPLLLFFGFIACFRTQSDIDRWEREFIVASFATKDEAKESNKEYNGKYRVERYKSGYILKREIDHFDGKNFYYK